MSAQNPTPGANTAPQHTSLAELLDDDAVAALTLDALASACRMDTGWVITRLQEGLLQTGTSYTSTSREEGSPTTWRFSSATVVRARRLAHLEVTFDADPELAALTTDLIEEVATLRQKLRHLQAR